MSKKGIAWKTTIILANLLVINGVVILFMNLHYPMVGHDYSLAIPSMLDALIHFRAAGLTIQWYSPSFGGGIPAFPDPNNCQFSLFAILPLFTTPWQAVIISSVFFISLGFLASYRFFFSVLKLDWITGILGAVFFSANGFMMERLAVGHMGYQTFPLLAVVVLLFFDTGFPVVIAGLLLGSVVAVLIYQAGFFLVIVFSLSCLMIFPIIYLLKSEKFHFKRIVIILIGGGLITLLLTASKLSAVFSFMRFFPRYAEDVYAVNPFLGFFGIILQLLGTMNLVPLFFLARLDPNHLPLYLIRATGGEYGYWEFDMSMSPVIFSLILLGLIKYFHSAKFYFRKFLSIYNLGAFFMLIFTTLLAVEFTLANGWFYLHLRQLPILSSLHVNARFAASFLFPLALLAAVIYSSISKDWTPQKKITVFITVNLLTLLPLSAYFLIKNDLQERIYDLTPSINIYQSIMAGKKIEVTGISAQETNTEAIQNGLSNLNLYDPIFGYLLEYFHPKIKPGSVWETSNGYFNMTNPSGFVFPEANGTRPFERIKVQDREKMLTFVNYQQSQWKIPLYQKICNWISSLALGSIMIVFFYYIFRAIRRNMEIFKRKIHE